MYQAQFGEDKFLEMIFLGITEGICVEVGAYDGISCSNTYFFEKNKGWKCLCIEPIPEAFQQCSRLRNWCVNYAVSNENKKDNTFKVYTMNNGYSCAISSLNPDERLIESHKHLLSGMRQISIETKTLTQILDEQSVPKKINFISIDTENTELDVLKGFDFDKYDVDIFIIENNFNEPYIENYMIEKKYNKISRMGVNDIYRKIKA